MKIIQTDKHYYELFDDTDKRILGSTDKARLLRYCKQQGINAEFIPLKAKKESTIFDPFSAKVQ